MYGNPTNPDGWQRTAEHQQRIHRWYRIQKWRRRARWWLTAAVWIGALALGLAVNAGLLAVVRAWLP